MPDVNGSRFHLRQTRRDWRRALSEAAVDVVFDGAARGLTLRPRLFRFPPRPEADRPGEGARRRGGAVDGCGNIFVIGEDRQSIDVYPVGGLPAGRYWPGEAEGSAPAAASFQPCPPPADVPAPMLRGLTVTCGNYLVAGTLAPAAGLLVFDLHGGGPPEHMGWPAVFGFAPFDMFQAADGGLWVLDRPDTGSSRWWRLDRRFRPVSGPETEVTPGSEDSFRPVGGTARMLAPETLPSGHPVAAQAVLTPLAICGLPDETVLILARRAGAGHGTVLRMRGAAIVAEVAFDAAFIGALADPPQALDVYDMALHVAEAGRAGVRGTLHVLAADGNQAFSFALHAAPFEDGDGLTLDLLPLYFPVRAFAGRGLAEHGADTLYDLADRYLPLIAQPRPRYEPAGSLERLLFDGEAPDQVWHRLAMDACIPPGDAILVESRAANTEAGLELAAWQAEPAPVLRPDGAEIPYHRPFDEPLPRGAGTWELLFQRPRGRFLELRLSFEGSGRSSPVLRALRVWSPRFSYLERYLPAAYRADPEAADFLDRFLANIEGLFTTMEGRVAEAQILFDARTAPDESLAWLAGWLGADLDFLDDPVRRRLLITHAPLLWEWRGTPAGVMAIVRLATDPCTDARIFDPLRQGTGLTETPGLATPRLIEGFLSRRFAPVALGDPAALDRPGQVVRGAPYDATQGAGPIHAAWRAFLSARYQGSVAALSAAWGRTVAEFEGLTFPAQTPVPSGAEEADWLAAASGAFPFTYARVGPADGAAWRSFLARRYPSTSAYAAAHGLATAPASLDTVALPGALPAQRTALADWLDFATRALPVARSAHRFVFLLPTGPDETGAARTARANRARAVLAREAPAHTEAEIRFFWSLLQVGTARLGIDTVVGEGARFTAVALGRTPLGQGFLAETHPWAVRDRRVVGRDTVREV